MKRLILTIRILLFLLATCILVSRTLAAGYSHDENQFVAAGQLLSGYGLLPYVDFPYAHMPYAVAMYAAAEKLTPFEFLAARLFSTLTWLASLALILALSHFVRSKPSSGTGVGPALLGLLLEFTLLAILVYHPLAATIPVLARNDSIATLFALLALATFVVAMRSAGPPYWSIFASGALIGVAALSRFNYASLIVVLAIIWLLHSLVFKASPWLPAQVRYWLGVFAASIPALLLYAAAPARFYYANLVYIRLNTLYYEGLLYRSGMDLVSKLAGFAQGLLYRPIDLLLHAVLVYVAAASFIGVVRRRSLVHLTAFAASGFAFVLLLTAFAPTPTFSQYFFAPLPFIVLLLAWLLLDLRRLGSKLAVLTISALLAVFFFTTRIQNPLKELSSLTRPRDWTPVQVHDYAVELRQLIPRGRVLSILPMFPLEAGFKVYPFLANGPFAWRTSLLLTAQRRLDYGVTSPDELPAILQAEPPIAVMTGFEAPNAGFERQDLGGLETPFSDYALAHNYRRVETTPRFLEHPIVVWISPSP